MPVIKNRYITTEENISYENARELEKFFTEEYSEQAESGVMYGIRFSTLQRNSTIANNFVLQAAMLYGAVVLLIILKKLFCMIVVKLMKDAFSSKITLKKRVLVHVVHGFQIKEKELFRYFIGLQLFQRIEIGDALVC